MNTQTVSESPSFLLYNLFTRMEKSAGVFLQEQFMLSYHQFLILCMIQEKDGLNQKQIADELELTESAISKQMTILKEKKYITISENQENRREKIILLTNKGVEILKKACALLEEKTDILFSVLNKNEYSNFTLSLNKLLNNIQ